jgi:hypothetical protein
MIIVAGVAPIKPNEIRPDGLWHRRAGSKDDVAIVAFEFDEEFNNEVYSNISSFS